MGRRSSLDVPYDVVGHHDGVIDHETDREGQGEQGDVIEGQAEGMHGRKGGHDGNGNGDARDQRRGKTADADIETCADETDREHQGEGDVLDGCADRKRAIVHRGERYVMPKLFLDLR